MMIIKIADAAALAAAIEDEVGVVVVEVVFTELRNKLLVADDVFHF